jgi:hypothetical protein
MKFVILYKLHMHALLVYTWHLDLLTAKPSAKHGSIF